MSVFSKESLLGGAGVGVVILLVYLGSASSHDATRAAQVAEHSRAVAEFDRDMARATGAPAERQQELADRVRQANAAIPAADAEAPRRLAQVQADRDELAGAARDELHQHTADKPLDPAAAVKKAAARFDG